jgi:hypothetical protein
MPDGKIRKSSLYAASGGPASSSVALSYRNTPGLQGMTMTDDVDPSRKLPEPSEMAIMQSGAFSSLDDVVKNLPILPEERAELKERLGAAGRGREAIHKSMPTWKWLGEISRNGTTVKMAAARFAAFLANGLVKDQMVQQPSGQQPPPGFSPIPNSKKGGFHKQVGNRYVYWYSGSGITSQSQEDPAASKGAAPAVPKPGAQPGQPAPPQGPPQAGAQQQGPPQAGQPQPGGAGQPGAKPAPGGAQQLQQPEVPLQGKAAKAAYLKGEHPDVFNKKSSIERAGVASFATVKQEMDATVPAPPFQVTDHAEIREAAGKLVRDYVTQGVIPHHSAQRMLDVGDRLAKDAKAVGLDPQTTGELVRQGLQKLAHQELKASERTIGDHGVRHISVNIETSHKILDALHGSGMEISPMQRLMATQAMVDHDMGYTIDAIHHGGFDVQDDFHPHASRKMFEEQPGLKEVFGDKFEEMARVIETHGSHEIDWEKDTVGSATRMADNCHLFADKMPELLFDDRKGVELMAKIALVKQAYGIAQGKAGIKASLGHAELKEHINSLRDAMTKHVEGRADIPPTYRGRLISAAAEIGPLTDVMLSSRLAGREPNFGFDAKAKRMDVAIQHSDVRQAIGEVFGPDEEDKQFVKLLESYKVDLDPSKIEGPPPPVQIDAGEGARFKWTGLGGDEKQHAHEKEFSEVLKSTQEEFIKIAGIKDEKERKAKLSAWTGVLSKSLRALLEG